MLPLVPALAEALLLPELPLADPASLPDGLLLLEEGGLALCDADALSEEPADPDMLPLVPALAEALLLPELPLADPASLPDGLLLLEEGGLALCDADALSEEPADA